MKTIKNTIKIFFYFNILVFGMLPVSIVYSYDITENLSISGFVHTWATVYEEMESESGLIQQYSEDPAYDTTTGFSINKARLSGSFHLLDNKLEFMTSFKLEDVVQLLDCYFRYSPLKEFSVYIGQQRIPNTYEALLANTNLDFILTSQITYVIADYSLSRSVYTSSLLYGYRSYYRDLGISVKGEFESEIVNVNYFLMIGNGLGINKYISGNTSKGFMITNPPDFFYGARLELSDPYDIITIGGHYNFNEHDNMIFNSSRAVYDLHRFSYSGDIQLVIPHTGIRITGMFAQGEVIDDEDNDEHKDLKYFGYEAKIIFCINDILTNFILPENTAENTNTTGDDDSNDQHSFLEDHVFEVGFRFDNYTTQTNGELLNNGEPFLEKQNEYTIGFNYMFMTYIKLQTNYIFRITDHPSDPDLDDDIFFINLQISI